MNCGPDFRQKSVPTRLLFLGSFELLLTRGPPELVALGGLGRAATRGRAPSVPLLRARRLWSWARHTRRPPARAPPRHGRAGLVPEEDTRGKAGRAPAARGGPHRSPDWVMSRRQVSICTSRPRFMLHISMYSCKWRFMSFLAVASSSCGRGKAGPSRSAGSPARTPRRRTRQERHPAGGPGSRGRGLRLKNRSEQPEGAYWTSILSSLPGNLCLQRSPRSCHRPSLTRGTKVWAGQPEAAVCARPGSPSPGFPRGPVQRCTLFPSLIWVFLEGWPWLLFISACACPAPRWEMT